jgi:hypothetical protein
MRMRGSAVVWFVVFVVVGGTTAFAQEQDYTYATNNGTITITGYTGPGGKVVIPEIINGLPVTTIGDRAFQGCTTLTGVTIPDNVTEIEPGGHGPGRVSWGAFSACTNLTTVAIGNGVTNIAAFTFWDCTSLTSVTIGKSVTSIGYYAFGGGCRSLTSITIPDSVAIIEYGGFEGCTGLTSITIPNSITSIGGRAFAACDNLTSIIIPNSVRSIGEEAFYYCDRLTTVTIGNSVTNIGGRAFAACFDLTAINVDSQNPTYSSFQGVLFDRDRTMLIQFPEGQAGSYIIPNGVTTIGDWAFAVCANLTNVTIGNGVTSIGEQAFWECTSLTTVTIGNDVTTIWDCAFCWCTNLTGVYFEGSAPSIDSGVFDQIGSTTLYYLPGTIGWGSSFGGRPTAPWLLSTPLILTAPNFGIQTNAFGFRISWATNASVVVEASADPTAQTWSPVSTNTLVDGWTDYHDSEWTNNPARLYRVRSL